MSKTTNVYGTRETDHIESRNQAGDVTRNPNQTATPRVNAGIGDSMSPNAPHTEELVVANFPSLAEAEKVASDLVAAGIPREQVIVVSDHVRQREFMSQYIRQDNDRHSHSSVSSAFFALGGAFALGLLGVVIAATSGAVNMVVGAVIGAVIGGLVGALLGKIAMRPADDRSMEVVEALAKEGTLVGVRHDAANRTSAILDDAGQVLTRHHGTAIRLRQQQTQADRLPGDTRTKPVPK